MDTDTLTSFILATWYYTNNGAGGKTQKFHHPDRLGTKLLTNNAANTSFEKSTLPFGTVLERIEF
ncbi:MAG: hypothetical protein ACR2L1_07700 [Pyrinomonadaceae bacterium]